MASAVTRKLRAMQNHTVCVERQSAAQEQAHMSAPLASGLLGGILKGRRSQEHWWGTPEEKYQGFSVRLLFFLK